MLRRIRSTLRECEATELENGRTRKAESGRYSHGRARRNPRDRSVREVAHRLRRSERNFLVPILAREVDLYPEDLLSDKCLRANSDHHWWALYTLSRREKDLMRKLQLHRLAFYGPTIAKRHRTPSGRILTSYIPLFANYVFIYGTESDRYAAVSLGCVSRCIPVYDEAGLARDLFRVWKLAQSGAPLIPESRLEPGRRVRIRSGPFRDCEGVILHRNGKTRLMVAVDFLQRGASLIIEDCDVEDLSEDQPLRPGCRHHDSR